MAPPPKLNLSIDSLAIPINIDDQLNLKSGTFNIFIERSIDGSGGKIQISGFISDPDEFAQCATFLAQQGQIS